MACLLRVDCSLDNPNGTLLINFEGSGVCSRAFFYADLSGEKLGERNLLKYRSCIFFFTTETQRHGGGRKLRVSVTLATRSEAGACDSNEAKRNGNRVVKYVLQVFPRPLERKELEYFTFNLPRWYLLHLYLFGMCSIGRL